MKGLQRREFLNARLSPIRPTVGKTQLKLKLDLNVLTSSFPSGYPPKSFPRDLRMVERAKSGGLGNFRF